MTIRALFFDVDGVLTDGRLYLDDEGHELKVFDTKDGHGVKMAIAAGLKVAWISGRTSEAVRRRAEELGVRAVEQGVADKRAAAERYQARWKISPEETAACGDDLPDVGLFEVAGLRACPADAVPELREKADLVLSRPGGHGAVRELVEEVLRRNSRDGETSK